MKMEKLEYGSVLQTLPLSLIYSFPSISQDGQLQPYRTGWLRLSETVIVSDSYFGSDSKRINIRTNALYTSNLSGEYGIHKRLTLFFNVPMFIRTTISMLCLTIRLPFPLMEFSPTIGNLLYWVLMFSISLTVSYQSVLLAILLWQAGIPLPHPRCALGFSAY
jgi:hypothetical protein